MKLLILLYHYFYHFLRYKFPPCENIIAIATYFVCTVIIYNAIHIDAKLLCIGNIWINIRNEKDNSLHYTILRLESIHPNPSNIDSTRKSSSNFIAGALGLLRYCVKPSICNCCKLFFNCLVKFITTLRVKGISILMTAMGEHKG